MSFNLKFLFFLFLEILDQKVLVIDDLGITKGNTKDKKNKSRIIDLIKKKTNSGNEEIVIYGKDNKNNGYKISSKNHKKDDNKIPRYKNRLRQNPDAFRPISNVEIDSPIIESNKTYEEARNEKNMDYRPYNLLNNDQRNIVPERKTLTSSFKLPSRNIPEFNNNPPYTPDNFSDILKKYDDLEQRQKDLQDLKNPLRNIPKLDNFSFPEVGSNLPLTPQIYDDNDEFNRSLMKDDFGDINLHHNTQEDVVTQLRNREKNNMLEAINSRRKYIDIKIEESRNKKSSLVRKIDDLKLKNEKLNQEISEIQRKREELSGAINMKKNHIRNLIANSGDLKEKEEKTLGLIRITKNEVIRYQNILENERSKLAILEKQFNVYDQTLNTYSNNINEDEGCIFRENNELEKINNDLNGLKQVYFDYQRKNELLVSEIRRQEKIESDLEIEKKKININDLENVYG